MKVLLMNLSLLLSMLLSSYVLAQQDYMFIIDAEVSNANSAAPPAAADWRPAALPRAWPRDPLHPEEATSAWYRIPLPQDAAERRWNHLLLLRHMMNLEVWLDDRFIGSGGPIYQDDNRLQRNWNRPLLLQIPDTSLAQGRMLYFRLHSAPQFGVMSPVFIGTRESLSSRYAIHHFLQIDLVKISLVAMLLLASLSLFIWLKTKQAGWTLTGLMSLCWSLPLLYILLPSTPLYEFNALRISHWGMVSGAVCLLAFVEHRYLFRPLLQMRWLAGIPAGTAILLAVVRDGWVVYVGSAGQVLCQALFLLLMCRMWRKATPPSTEVLIVIGSLAVMLLASLHDVSLVTSPTAARWRWDTPLSYITQPIILLIISGYGIRAFVRRAADLDAANGRLQARLEQAEAEIRTLYAEQETLERDIRIEAERELSIGICMMILAPDCCPWSSRVRPGRHRTSPARRYRICVILSAGFWLTANLWGQ